jgi:hypothetical protein
LPGKWAPPGKLAPRRNDNCRLAGDFPRMVAPGIAAPPHAPQTISLSPLPPQRDELDRRIPLIGVLT